MSNKRRVSRFEFRGDIEISLVEDFENDSANGTRLWEAGMLLSRFVEVNMGVDKLKGRKVLELGAGTGLLGLYLSRLRADVLMVDYNELVLRLLKENVKENKSKAKVEKFDWSDGEAVQRLCEQQFDYIMGADCVFSLEATRSLVRCLETLCTANSGTIVYMSIETRDDAVTKCFVDEMEAANFSVVITSQKGVDPQYRHEDVQIYRCQRK